MIYYNYTEREEGADMTMAEAARLMKGLRLAGWDDTRIVNFVIWVETGDAEYEPKAEK